MAILQKAEEPLLSAYSPSVEQRKRDGMEPDDLLCSRNARPYPQKEVKVEAQVEQRQIRSVRIGRVSFDALARRSTKQSLKRKAGLGRMRARKGGAQP